jgi:uncharacterized membrane protein required for colicin V production
MPRTIAFTWMDWLTLAIVLVSVLRGARYGVLAGAADLVVLVAAFLGAAALYSDGAWLLRRSLPALPAPWAAFIAFVVIWAGLYLPAGLLARAALDGEAAPGSRMLGGALGALRGLVLSTILLVILLAAPFHRTIAADAQRSRVAPYLLRANERIGALLLPALPVRVPRIGPGGRMF